MQTISSRRQFLSLILLMVPAFQFCLLLFIYRNNISLHLSNEQPIMPWQFYMMASFGTVATIGGVLDWRFHRDPLKLKIPKKERHAEAKVLGLSGLPTTSNCSMNLSF